MKSSVVTLIPPLGALLYSASFNMFADRIPHGHRVPNPNPQGGIWAGVGHFKAGGGGALNPFGQDFLANGYEWTIDLCEKDSDGDGRSNGMELGDPDCVWEEGDEEPSLPSLSHPGIPDEPQDEPAMSSCSNYQEPNEIIEYDIQFSEPAQIGDEETYYMCEQMMMPVPSAQKLHKIKSSVLLDNSAVLHHMFVYLCFQGTTGDGNRVGEGAYSCNGAESVCMTVGDWAVGPSDRCLPPNIGTEFDFTGMENVLVKIEAHYDNPQRIPQQDQSGISITFTPQLRPLSSGSVAMGMDVINKDFIIPGLSEAHPLTSICPSEATSAVLTHPVYVFQFYPHMHYKGYTMKTEQYRCGKKIGTFGEIVPYEFDNQQLYQTHAKILPGDALVTTCEYNTLDTNETILSGLGTEDEMCLSITSFYPKLERDNLLQACFSFEHGIALDRVDPGTAPPPGENPADIDPSVIATLLEGRFVLISSNPAEGILTNFSSDPTTSWAPCCETNSCDVDFLAAEGEACGQDADCMGMLTCDGGLCVGGGDAEVEDGNQQGTSDGASQKAWQTVVLGLIMAPVIAFFVMAG